MATLAPENGTAGRYKSGASGGYKRLTLFAAALFILVNTGFYWEPWIGPVAMLVTLFLVLAFIVLLVLTAIGLVDVVVQRFTDRSRLLHVCVTSSLLLPIFFCPFRLIDVESLRGRDLLVASREGAANCTTTLRLKEGGDFFERIICFGVSEVSGSYELRGDTILFNNVVDGRNHGEYYQFAIIGPVVNGNRTLTRYRDANDTLAHELWITQQDLGGALSDSR